MVGIWTFRHNEAKIGQVPLFSSIDFVLVELSIIYKEQNFGLLNSKNKLELTFYL